MIEKALLFEFPDIVDSSKELFKENDDIEKLFAGDTDSKVQSFVVESFRRHILMDANCLAAY